MKKAIISVTLLALVLCMCSCKKAENENTAANDKKKPVSISDVQNSAPRPDLDQYLDQLAGTSGDRLNEKIKEKEEAEKEANSTKSDSADDKDKDDSGKAGSELGSNDKIPETNTELHELMEGGYAEALSDEELTKTVKLALTYISKTFGKTLKATDLKAVDEKSDLYKKYPLYNKGNIIIFTCDIDGTEKNIVVARVDKTSGWKVLEKNV